MATPSPRALSPIAAQWGRGGVIVALRATAALIRAGLLHWHRPSVCRGKRMSVDVSDLAKLYPLDKLRPENLEQLAREATIEETVKGAVLFKAGDTDDHTIFLLAGRVRGDYPDGKTKEVDASTLQGRYALGDLQPRRFTATVVSFTATLIKIDRRYMEKIQTWDQLSRSETFQYYDPSPDANRWVFRLLLSRALHKLPT